ncbi:MAG: hypothetical protein ACLPH3_19545 [Terracidiphilus sp.]
MKPLFLVSVVCLAVGLGVLFGYCNGAAKLSLGDSLPAISIHVDITTTGVPALTGVPLTLIGAFLLIVAWFLALFGRSKQSVVEPPPRRREEPFRE